MVRPDELEAFARKARAQQKKEEMEWVSKPHFRDGAGRAELACGVGA